MNYRIRNLSHVATHRVYSPGSSTLLRKMTSWPPSWKGDVKSEIRFRQSMCIQLKNILIKFHPDFKRGSLMARPHWRRSRSRQNVEVDKTSKSTFCCRRQSRIRPRRRVGVKVDVAVDFLSHRAGDKNRLRRQCERDFRLFKKSPKQEQGEDYYKTMGSDMRSVPDLKSWARSVNNILSVTVKWLAVKTASEMTYIVSGGAINSTQCNPISEQ